MRLILRSFVKTALSALMCVASQALAQVTVTLTAPTNGATYVSPAAVTLTATATPPSGYTISKVEFFQGTTLIGTDTGAPYSITWSNVQPGPYALTAKATAIKKNNPNQTGTSSVVNIAVNARPAVSIATPQNGITFAAPGNITVSANASDSDGSVTSVQFLWFESTGSDSGSTTLTAAPYSFVWTVNPTFEQQTESGDDAVYVLHAVATDNQGATASSGVLTFTVGPSVAITAPNNGASYTAPANIVVNVSVSPNYPLALVEYYQGTTLIGESSGSPGAITWQNVSAGTYSLTAKAVSWAGSQWTSPPITVTVNPVLAEPQLHFVQVDHLNTPRLVANQAGQTVWRWDQQEPFGVNVPDENPSGLGAFEFPLRFPGQYFDKETNLFYNYFRDYDPSVGRYVTSDLIGLKGGLNTFAYAGLNPLSLIDPHALVPLVPPSDEELCRKCYEWEKACKDFTGRPPRSWAWQQVCGRICVGYCISRHAGDLPAQLRCILDCRQTCRAVMEEVCGYFGDRCRKNMCKPPKPEPKPPADECSE